MNPLNFEEVIKKVGEINKAVYGVNPYTDKGVEHLADFKHATEGKWPDDEFEGDDKYANLSSEDDIFSQEKEE